MGFFIAEAPTGVAGAVASETGAPAAAVETGILGRDCASAPFDTVDPVPAKASGVSAFATGAVFGACVLSDVALRAVTAPAGITADVSAFAFEAAGGVRVFDADVVVRLV
ncbi:hypothetical protein FACS189449_04320 [Alphaproteobacteria bacterium]|nr:hypothetical protein FACS189449_04320 [Alphaproteobacteria bacterium]